MNQVLAPSRLLAVVAAITLLLVVALYLVATRLPWLGIEFQPAAQGLVVAYVDPRSPNAQLQVGDVVVAMASNGIEEHFDAKLLPIGEFTLPTFAILNRYLAIHDALWKILTSGDFEFVLSDGKRLQGHAASRRPATDLPFQFWSLTASGVLAILIGVGIWAYRPQLPASPLIVVSAVGVLLFELLAGLYSSRELTLPPFWLRASADELNLASEIAIYGLVALLWYYPTPRHRFPFAMLCFALVLLIWTNESLQITDLPYNTYVLHYLFAGALIIGLALFQWRQTHRDALSRAALQWYLLTFVVSYGIALVLAFVPMIYLGHAFIPKYGTFYLFVLFYLGLAFGIARYRLFDIERWWVEVWLWLAGGLLVIGIDALLIMVFHLTDLLALGLALILAGWVYLPLRQWLFRRVLRSSPSPLNDHFPLLVETLFGDDPLGSFGVRWQRLVQRVFAPMALTVKAQPALAAELAESGLALRVPSFDGKETLELRFREQGRRLYKPRDAALADSLLALTRRAESLWRARADSARAERTRILRDLHDDVGARLLTLAQRDPGSSTQTQAREALGALRHIIYALDDKTPLPLQDLLNELEAQLRERARLHGIDISWTEPENIPDIRFGARENINLQRSMAEATSNAICHCTPTHFTVQVWIEAQELHLHFCNDGVILQTEDWVAGKGINNIRNRIHELGGTVRWNTNLPTAEPENTLCCMEIRIPLPVGTVS